MDLYILLLDSNHKAKEPSFEYDGELIQHALVKNKDTRLGKIKTDDEISLPDNAHTIVTTQIKRRENYKILAYLNGKRVTSKIVAKDKTVYHESDKLIVGIIMDIKLGFI